MQQRRSDLVTRLRNAEAGSVGAARCAVRSDAAMQRCGAARTPPRAPGSPRAGRGSPPKRPECPADGSTPQPMPQAMSVPISEHTHGLAGRATSDTSVVCLCPLRQRRVWPSAFQRLRRAIVGVLLPRSSREARLRRPSHDWGLTWCSRLALVSFSLTPSRVSLAHTTLSRRSRCARKPLGLRSNTITAFSTL